MINATREHYDHSPENYTGDGSGHGSEHTCADVGDGIVGMVTGNGAGPGFGGRLSGDSFYVIDYPPEASKL